MHHNRSLRARLVGLAATAFCLPCALPAASPSAGGCKLDWNRDGRVDVLDLIDPVNLRGYFWEWYVLVNYPSLYLSVFPNGSAAEVDWNRDGRITVDDLTGKNPLGFYWHVLAYLHPRTQATYLATFPGTGCPSPSGSVGNIVERDLVGRKTLLVIPISLSRSSYAPIATQAAAQAHGVQVAQLLSQHSHGKLNLQVTATPVLDLPQQAGHYFWGGMNNARINADIAKLASQRGYNINAYDYALVLSPKFWANNEGFAPAWKIAFVSKLKVPLSAHELGHTFGWAHAARWDCGSGTNPLCTYGFLVPDGDEFDLMGQNIVVAGRYGAWQQKRARWISDKGALRVTGSGTYRIKSLHIDPRTFGPREYSALELRVNDVDSYWVFFRGDEPMADDGVMIVRATNAIRGQSILYDMTPGSSGTWQDAALTLGRTFTDPSAGISVTVQSVTATFIDVRVTVPWSIGSIPEPPVIDVVSPTRHNTVRGRWTFKVTAYAPSQGMHNGAGIRRVTLRLNGNTMVAFTDVYQPPFTLVVDTNSWTVPDGEYRLFVEAEDFSGRKTQAVFPTLIDNTGPSF